MTRLSLLSALVATALAGGLTAQTVNINCGGGAMTTSDGTQWSADMDFNGGDLLYTGYSIANTNPQDLYLLRSGRAGLYGDFSYNIPVPNGSYTVTLHFAEIQYSSPGQRVFNVVINGATVLSNFDILTHAPVLTPFTQQFPVTVTNGAVQIAVNGVVAKGLVNAIQVAPATGTPPSNPALSVGSTALSFSGTSGSANPSAQSVTITNSGTGTLSWTASTAASWLSVSPASGMGAGSISIQPSLSGLAAGTYSGTVTVSASGATGSPATIGVTLTVGAAATPSLSVASKTLSFAGTAGSANPSAQSVAITNSGSGTLNWTASTATSWLAVSPASGTGAGSLSIQPNLSGLAAGTYSGSVTVSAAGATGSPVAIGVTLVVAAAAPPPTAAISINCAGGSMTTSDGTQWSADNYFSGGDQFYSGSAIAGVAPQDLYLYRSARYGLYGDFSYSIPVANGSYTVTLLFAELQYNTVGDRVFNVAINGSPALSNFDILTHVPVLTPYEQQFSANVTNGILRIDVTGVVRRGILNAIQVATSGPLPPSPAVSTTALSFSGVAGGSNPATQTATVSNSGSGTLSWTASSNQGWLTVSPASGTNSGTLTIGANVGSLAAGTYNGTITVAGGGSSQSVAVTFTVAGPPSLSVSTTALSFSGSAGGSNPASQTATVSNSGGGTLSWTASSNQGWLTVSPASGSNSGTLTIGANLASLSAGTYNGSITVSGGGSTKTIGVTLTVAASQPATLSVSTASLSFAGTAGAGNPSAQTATVSNSGGGTLSWTASSSQGWLSVSPASGTNSGTLSIGANITGLSAGNYNGTITVNGGSAGSKTVSVGLAVAAASGPPPTSGNSWYVTVSGSSSGDGSAAHPWDLNTALNGATSKAQPGDTIWLRAGKYGDGTVGTVITSSLVGTASAPIIVRAYPGERVTIDNWLQVGCCDQANNPAAGSYTWFWGLEFASFNSNRTSGTSGPPEWAAQYNHAAADTWGAGTKFINCIVHDTAGGLSVWDADNTELNGNMVYNVGGYGTDRGHGHLFYMQNIAPAVLKATDNIGFNNFDMGIQAYASGTGAWVQNIQLAGNIVFNSGILYGQVVDNITIGGGQGGPSGIVLNNNFTYFNPNVDQGYNEAGFLWTPISNDAVITNNYFIGGKQAIDLERWNTLTYQNNTVYAPVEDEAMLITNTGQNSASYTTGGNRYFGSGQWRIDPQCGNWPCPSTQAVNFANWQSLTGMDATSTFTTGAPTGVWTTVRPNQYEAGRANIVIYNWDLKASVSVDLSGSGIKVGDNYQIRDAENWYNGPVASGVYNGSPVSVPMTGLTVVQPFGVVPYPPSHTAPQFGAFVLLSGTSLTNNY
jgi:Malectin domain/Viral BACON domain